MENLKHTQGPWTISDKRTTNKFGTIEINIDAKKQGILSLASVYAFYNGDVVGESNANLIAAAPELLEACVKCMNVFKKLSDAGKYPEVLMQENGGEGLRFLKEAIAKAKGGQQ